MSKIYSRPGLPRRGKKDSRCRRRLPTTPPEGANFANHGTPLRPEFQIARDPKVENQKVSHALWNFLPDGVSSYGEGLSTVSPEGTIAVVGNGFVRGLRCAFQPGPKTGLEVVHSATRRSTSETSLRKNHQETAKQTHQHRLTKVPRYPTGLSAGRPEGAASVVQPEG